MRGKGMGGGACWTFFGGPAPLNFGGGPSQKKRKRTSEKKEPKFPGSGKGPGMG